MGRASLPLSILHVVCTGVVNSEHPGLGRPNGASVAMNYAPEGRRVAHTPMTGARFQPERINGVRGATNYEPRGLTVFRMTMTVARNGLAHRRGEF